MLFLFTAQTWAITGGCISSTDSTAGPGTSAFASCQLAGYNGSVECNRDSNCTWAPEQYYQLHCEGTVTQDGFCPPGSPEISFNSSAPENEKFKCCKSGNSGSGRCCNRGGNVVSTMTPCPTSSNPYQCCNPAGEVANGISTSNCEGRSAGRRSFRMKRR